MVISTRVIRISKEKDDIKRIVNSYASSYARHSVTEDGFSIWSSKRHNGGVFSFTPIKGYFIYHDQCTEVRIELHADIRLYLGVALIIFGLLGLSYCLISTTARWIPEVGKIIIGVMIIAQSLLEGTESIERLCKILLQFNSMGF